MIRPEVPILYCDDDVVVVNKPTGYVVHRGWARDPVVVMTLVRDALGAWVYPVHRLDRGTSGALAFARHPEAQKLLSRAFEAQEIEKSYLALVRGRLYEPATIDYAIPRSEDGERVAAVTDYTPLLTLDRFTLVEARPRTGRLRQIRRHFKHIGHPIALDKRHGRGEFHVLARERYGFERMVLHARRLVFQLPSSGRRLEIVAPLGDLAVPFERLGVEPALLGAAEGARLID